MNRLGLLMAMGLAGILTVALIVSADQSVAGVDGLRAVTAHPPASEQDPVARPAVAVLTGLGGLLDGLRGGLVFGPEPVAPAVAAAGASEVPAPAGASGPPSNAVSGPSDARGPAQPAAATPAPNAPPTPAQSMPAAATPAIPAATPAPVAPPAPTARPLPDLSAPPPTPSPAAGLALTTDRGASAIVSLGDLVPGDTIDRTITLRNSGTLGFRYAVSATQTASTPLWTDVANGIQLTVRAFDGTVLYSGPASGLGSLARATPLAPGDTELLRYAFALPAGASNALQGLVQDLTLVFTATQYP